MDDAVNSVRGFAANDFCVDILTRAYPEAKFDITKSDSRETGIATSQVTIAAHRSDAPPGTDLSNDVAVECTFDHNVLTSFSWTKGPFRAS